MLQSIANYHTLVHPLHSKYLFYKSIFIDSTYSSLPHLSFVDMYRYQECVRFLLRVVGTKIEQFNIQSVRSSRGCAKRGQNFQNYCVAKNRK